ncbi:thioredoxin domain-containing protein [Rosistilla oblonga]|uniref:thioredoxin domain-containing protein n=1 Tax=Rosistilla oblonga TaxID=2527990 RepID=UPI001E456A03|nr:thioredoxin domain-containing protein [Rosistilla oblonga]
MSHAPTSRSVVFRPFPAAMFCIGVLIAIVLPGRPAGADEPPGKQHPPNRLAAETSPYLLQHARNPVDWYPWGDEAFAKAKAENKPIFLSVGYSSCHWCHVMERESFADAEIAKYLNEHFVCIKVDREERPDVDAIYMQAVQLLTQRGGWPMSVFMTTDAKPFYGGSYFPARDGDREGAPGFLSLIQAIQTAWERDHDQILASGDQMTDALQKQMDLASVLPAAEPSLGLVTRVGQRLAEEYDAEHGGFGFVENQSNRPKFPEPSNLFYLLHRATDESLDEPVRDQALAMLTRTLDKMAAGGIQDHLGGGFHRYSVDRFWYVPHFEKMLYDNGQLASVYARAFALTGNPEYRWVVEDLLAWSSREMLSPEGGFYSAIDADSEGEEGAFYRWTKDDLKAFAGDPNYARFAATYHLDGEPNFEGEYFVPRTDEPLAAIAEPLNSDAAALRETLAPLRATMLAARAKRTAPITDTKILTSWNGLMIRGYADAGRLLQQPEYVEVAKRAATFVLKSLRQPDGTLFRTYSAGQAKLNGYVDDYAFFVDGLIAIHEATGEPQWLDAARTLTDIQIAQFWDEKRDGFYFTSQDHQSLIARAKDPVDSAIPSGNSVAAENLLYLDEHIESPTQYRDYAQRTISNVAGLLKRSPTSAPRAAVSMAKILAETKP